MTGRHVGDLPAAEEILAEVAEVLVAGRTTGAPPARGDEPEDHVVPDRQPRDLGADLHDLPRSLVAADHRELLDAQLLLRLVGQGQVSGEQVLVGVAQA